jgi:uncharacterized membrane protein
MSNATPSTKSKRKRLTPTYFFLRGLAIILPPILTVVILVWVATACYTYIIYPVNMAVRYVVAQARNDIQPKDSPRIVPPPPDFPSLPEWGKRYRVTDPPPYHVAGDQRIRPTAEDLLSEPDINQVYVPFGNKPDPDEYVPLADYNFVYKQLRPQPPPATAIGMYMEIAGVRSFPTALQLNALALSITVIALYFLGRFVTVRIGAWFVHKFETVLTRVPLVRNVYSTVKQVTDFVLSEREIEFRRAVAIEYPRAGSWVLGFVTGEGMLDCAAAAGEPLVTVLVPTSPVPMGGFTVMVPRRQVVDLNLTIDQSVQFIVSCGVLTPPAQQTTPELLEKEMRKRISAAEPATVGQTAALDSGNGQ